MNDLNDIILTGRVTRDAELQYTHSGTAFVNFSVAVNEGVKQSDGVWKDVANFFEITLWGKQAETLARFLSKGKQVSVQGRLKQQTWQTEDGKNRSKVTINAQFIQLLGTPDGGNEQQGRNSTDRRYERAIPQQRKTAYRDSQSAIAGFAAPNNGDEQIPPELFCDDDIPF